MALKTWMWIGGLALGIAALGFGCTGKESAQRTERAGKVIAKINGTPITEEDLSLRFPPGHGIKTSGNQEKALDDLIAQELLYEHGLKIGLDKDPAYQAVVARLERELTSVKRAEMTRRVYHTQVAPKIEITQAEAKDYYEKNAGRISTELHLGVIAFNNRERAEETLKQIRSGAPFESVARNLMGNQASTGREPWDLGFVSWDRVPVDFVEAVYRLKSGEVSHVVSSKRTGWQIFKLLESRKNPKADFASLAGTIMNRLRDEKAGQAYDQYVEKLKKEARIEKF